jgi:hypothetical protein
MLGLQALDFADGCWAQVNHGLVPGQKGNELPFYPHTKATPWAMVPEVKLLGF